MMNVPYIAVSKGNYNLPGPASLGTFLPVKKVPPPEGQFKEV
jgi:hypothetical protein